MDLDLPVLWGPAIGIKSHVEISIKGRPAPRGAGVRSVGQLLARVLAVTRGLQAFFFSAVSATAASLSAWRAAFLDGTAPASSEVVLASSFLREAIHAASVSADHTPAPDRV